MLTSTTMKQANTAYIPHYSYGYAIIIPFAQTTSYVPTCMQRLIY